MSNAHDVVSSRLSASTPLVQMVKETSNPGGAEPNVGFNFKRLNVAGEQLIFVENPRMDDEELFPRRLTNGNLAMSSSYYLLDFEADDMGQRNIEIRTRGREGVNRNLVYLWQNGMTGYGSPDSPVDAIDFHMLKETLLAAYNTKSCGILKPTATA